MASLVERYYNVLQAPHKELIWFTSGHGMTHADVRPIADADGEPRAQADLVRAMSVHRVQHPWLDVPISPRSMTRSVHSPSRGLKRTISSRHARMCILRGKHH